jgi:hypothetical protein
VLVCFHFHLELEIIASSFTLESRGSDTREMDINTSSVRQLGHSSSVLTRQVAGAQICCTYQTDSWHTHILCLQTGSWHTHILCLQTDSWHTHSLFLPFLPDRQRAHSSSILTRQAVGTLIYCTYQTDSWNTHLL